MRVAVMGKMPIKGYSGGRYSAWTMIEALAHMGDEVFLISNAVPMFSSDFKTYPAHKNINTIVLKDYKELDNLELNLDYLIYIPDISSYLPKYFAMAYAIKRNIRFAMVNFETPNWFNEYAKMGRDETVYENLKNVISYGCLVISIAKTSEKYAKEYYDKRPEKTVFEVWCPAINSRVADEVNAMRENQIMIFTRITDEHKGGKDFLEILGKEISGAKVLCVSGIANVSDEYIQKVKEKQEKYDITVEYAHALSDAEKFRELKKSKVLLFPSHFEGYGYPPVEALYCGTKCLAYDLPVLREISGDAIEYFTVGDTSSMRKRAGELLKETSFEQVLVDTSSFEKQAERIHNILVNNYNNPALLHDEKEKEVFLSEIEHILKETECKKVFNPSPFKMLAENGVEITSDSRIKEETWKDVKKAIEGKKIFLWGAGTYYEKLYPKYEKRVNPIAILDKNPSLKGKKDPISNLWIVENPEVLNNYDPNEVAVLISNKNYVDEIIHELKEKGIENVHSMCVMEMNEFNK